MIYVLTLFAQVPVICRIEETTLFCNAPYVLHADGPNGSREIERGGPDIRTLAPLPDGERYRIEAAI